jgi:formylglycine-generating enzyme
MRRRFQVVGLAIALGTGAIGRASRAGDEPPAPAAAASCPAEMVRIDDYCIDRWEASLIDAQSGGALSPYYPPHPRLLARVHAVWQIERELLGDESARAMPLPIVPVVQRADFSIKAVSAGGVVPQGYLTQHLARRACEAAGKRLCSEQEWTRACRGKRQLKFPYGSHYVAGRCNIQRGLHPAHVLHGSASIGHTDPRLNLVLESVGAELDPLLRPTGATAGCVSRWDGDALYDMVGNLDEWIDDDRGVFVGGFYARGGSKGCEAKISSHAPSYYDYSTGTRCCRDAD